MTVEGQQALRDRDHAREVVAATCFPATTGAPPGRVGLEVEAFCVRPLPDGSPGGRVPLRRLAGLLDVAAGDRSLVGPRGPGVDPAYPLATGGTLTFEPGGQLEHATAAHPGPSAALAEVERVAADLSDRLAPHAVLAAAGASVWEHDEHVPMELAAPRYRAMAAYFDRRGPHGAAMMRRSCALQVNLDLGDGADRAERWLVANLAAPLACATFAASPGPAAVSRRALAWQRLDPTRTGFPRKLLDGSSTDPVEQLADAALGADVLLVRDGDASWAAGSPGWTFGGWLGDGHPRHGRPTVDDLRYHLTTLFLEVRPRGWLELRSLDALPARLRPAAVVLLAGLVEDPGARATARGLLEPHLPLLAELWRRAATAGLADPLLGRLATGVWPAALEGAARQPATDPAHLEAAAGFLERHALRGRCPADELRAALARGPAAALAWAASPDPVPVTV